MPELNEVQPGDLITARLINTIIQLLKELELKLGGPVTVPNLFGETLGNARNVLTSNTPPLVLGPVLLDSNGLAVNPNHQDNQNRRVIGQVPAAGSRVVANSIVNLLISGLPSATTPGNNAPEVTGFLPESTPMLEEVQILGKNFASQPGNNIVRINGVQTQTPSVRSTNFSLYILVPSGLPNVPTQQGATPVPVTVTVLNQSTGKEVTSTGVLRVGPASGIAKPTITGLSAATPRAGSSLTINGTGFGSNPEAVRVFFSGEPSTGVVPTQLTPTAVTITIPTTLSGVSAGVEKQFVVKVRVNTEESLENPQSVVIVRPPLIL
ncbi:IPT/TIG domain-containing protein [Pyxidicoccus xibeiensis]|uniref:IPT/TIG domain-containing protein n=1 Tax=Pyxidicoccus xibeiensis TaxID=2906759 RepID=UPI0020A75ED5|nr:IPT/TIG domain-containing protein [Pyxidicoccus xibeiensis]MCP3137354.1 IPT/TIG domain-containing protein [Pyxidicoccus xibeiensis]